MIDNTFGIRNEGILCRKGLVDSVNEESLLGELKKLKDKWKRKTAQQICVATAFLSGSKITKQIL